jgi:hypothetical protein
LPTNFIYLPTGILDRSHYATLVNGLTKANATAVFFDLDFRLPGSTNGDTSFADAINTNGKVVVGLGVDRTGNNLAVHHPTGVLREALCTDLQTNYGHLELKPDAGNIVRRLPIRLSPPAPNYLPFSWVAANRIRNLTEPTSKPLWLNHYNEFSSGIKNSNRIGIEDALGMLEPFTPGAISFFSNAIVIVGPGKNIQIIGDASDQFRNPWQRVPGVDLQAAAILNYINNDYLKEIEKPMQLLVSFGLGIVALMICASTTRKHAIVAAICFSISVFILSLILHFKIGFWWNWASYFFVTFPLSIIGGRVIGRPFKYDVFISYKRSKPDRPGGSGYAGTIHQILKNSGIHVFMDSKFGHDEFGNSNGWKELAEHHIKNASRLILIMSGRCFDECTSTDDPVAWEVDRAYMYGINIIPITFSDYQPPKLSKGLLTPEKTKILLERIRTNDKYPLSDASIDAIREALACSGEIRLTEKIIDVMNFVPLTYPDRSETEQSEFTNNLLKRIRTKNWCAP